MMKHAGREPRREGHGGWRYKHPLASAVRKRDVFDRGAKWFRESAGARLVSGDPLELRQKGVELGPVVVVFCELAVFAGDNVLRQS